MVRDSSGTPLFNGTYSYFENGNVDTEIVNGSVKSFVYDGLGRLTEAADNA